MLKGKLDKLNCECLCKYVSNTMKSKSCHNECTTDVGVSRKAAHGEAARVNTALLKTLPKSNKTEASGGAPRRLQLWQESGHSMTEMFQGLVILAH
jgi:hypothetical protein